MDEAFDYDEAVTYKYKRADYQKMIWAECKYFREVRKHYIAKLNNEK